MDSMTREAIRRSVVAGFLFFALVMSVGHAMAADSGSDEGGGTINTVVSNAAPVVTQFDLRNPSGNASLMGSQLDVRTTYWVWVTVYESNNWTDVKQLDVNLWYDGGSSELTYDAQTTGANYRVNITYANEAVPVNAPLTSHWSLQSGNVNFTASSIAIYTITPNQRYSFRIPFELRSQIRQANDPVTSGTTAYDDLGSWNAQFVAIDYSNIVVTQQKSETTSVFYEFGVFRYTDVAFSGGWSGQSSVAPGASVNTDTKTISYSSNGPYKVRVYLTSNFTDGTDKFGPSQATIVATGDMGSNQTFAGLGLVNAIYVLGTGGAFHAHDVASNVASVNLQFRIAVPLGTPAGTYTASVVVRIDVA